MIRPALLALLLGFSLVAAPQTQRKPTTVPAAKPAQDEQLYRNTAFGFRYKIPYGWVDRTREMREQWASNIPDTPGTPDSNPKKPDSKEKSANQAHGEVLLAVFERPPDAIGQTINSAIVIASESAAAYPGLKKAEDYLGPLTDLTSAKGFKPEGDPEVIEIDSRQLVRADFTKPLPARTNDKLTMRQSTLILLARGQIISFTFIAGSEDEVDDLIEGLHFGPAKPAAH